MAKIASILLALINGGIYYVLTVVLAKLSNTKHLKLMCPRFVCRIFGVVVIKN